MRELVPIIEQGIFLVAVMSREIERACRLLYRPDREAVHVDHGPLQIRAKLPRGYRRDAFR